MSKVIPLYDITSGWLI